MTYTLFLQAPEEGKKILLSCVPDARSEQFELQYKSVQAQPEMQAFAMTACPTKRLVFWACLITTSKTKMG